MDSRLRLEAALVDVLRAEAAIAPLLAELAALARKEDADRIGAVAYAARVWGDGLTDALSQVFAAAGEVSASAFDGLSRAELKP